MTDNYDVSGLSLSSQWFESAGRALDAAATSRVLSNAVNDALLSIVRHHYEPLPDSNGTLFTLFEHDNRAFKIVKITGVESYESEYLSTSSCHYCLYVLGPMPLHVFHKSIIGNSSDDVSKITVMPGTSFPIRAGVDAVDFYSQRDTFLLMLASASLDVAIRVFEANTGHEVEVQAPIDARIARVLYAMHVANSLNPRECIGAISLLQKHQNAQVRRKADHYCSKVSEQGGKP